MRWSGEKGVVRGVLLLGRAGYNYFDIQYAVKGVPSFPNGALAFN